VLDDCNLHVHMHKTRLILAMTFVKHYSCICTQQSQEEGSWMFVSFVLEKAERHVTQEEETDHHVSAPLSSSFCVAMI